jgi:hypothetical protein
MAAAVPPRPSFRIPRPDPSTRPSTRPSEPAPVSAVVLSRDSEAPSSEPAPESEAVAFSRESEARLSLHSVDLEELPEARSDSHQRATLPPPLEDADPLDVVMDALRGLKCLRAVEAASVCLAAVVRAVGCRAAVAHLWDANEGTFVIAYALGPNAEVLLNCRHEATDPLLAESFANRVPRVINHEARPPLPRHSAIGGAWSVLVAPVLDGSAPLGAIELVDPLDGSCFDDRHIAATRYATERLVALLHDADSSIGTLIAPPAE